MQPKMPASARRRARMIQAIVQRIASRGDQIAGHQREVRAGLVGHIDGALPARARLRNGLRWMSVNCTRRSPSRSGGRFGNLQVLLAQVIADALDEYAVAERPRAAPRTRRRRRSGRNACAPGCVPSHARRRSTARSSRASQQNRKHCPGDRQSASPSSIHHPGKCRATRRKRSRNASIRSRASTARPRRRSHSFVRTRWRRAARQPRSHATPAIWPSREHDQNQQIGERSQQTVEHFSPSYRQSIAIAASATIKKCLLSLLVRRL